MQSSNYYQPNPQHQYMMQPPLVDDSVASNSVAGGEEEDSDESGMPDKRSGRRKIKIEYINDKSRRHITFSKRKAGIMKKAYELSTLTGTQVLLLVVSETGLVYTFTTPKLQPLVTKPEGKNLIQSCLNAPDPMDSQSMDNHPHHQQAQQQQPNSRSIMSTNAPTSPSTTHNNNYYRSSNQSTANNSSLDSINNNYTDDRKTFGSMVASNPSLVLNNAATADPSNYSMPYAPYSTTANTQQAAGASTNSTGASLYPYNLPPQQQQQDSNDNRYWNNNAAAGNTTTIKRERK